MTHISIRTIAPKGKKYGKNKLGMANVSKYVEVFLFRASVGYFSASAGTVTSISAGNMIHAAIHETERWLLKRESGKSLRLLLPPLYSATSRNCSCSKALEAMEGVMLNQIIAEDLQTLFIEIFPSLTQ